jgi:ferrous iron transport protein B
MHCSNPTCNLKIPSGTKKIVLAGNPNVGKSVFFNALTGLYVDVSNFPGTTVDISIGQYKDAVIMDTPGVYGVSSFNDEERVARDVILFADVIVNVVDAVHLERDLFLTQQIIDMGIPVVVALNMMDEVERNGLKIDVKKLSEELGVDVIPTTAIKKEGIDAIRTALEKPRVGNRIPEVKNLIEKVIDKVDIAAEALLVVEEDENILHRYQLENKHGQREHIYILRRNRVDSIVNAVVSEINQGASFKTKLGRWMLTPLTGIPILFLILYLIYQFIGVFVAQTIVDFTEGILMSHHYYHFIINIMTKIINPETFLGQLLIGDFGILTMAPIYLFGLLLPLVVGFYFVLSIMEDSGYLPRMAALTDRILIGLGLNGRAIIPIILGFGCVTAATITTRLLGSKRERFIATMLLGLAIPCSAQLGVIAGLITPLGSRMILLYVLTIFIVFALVGTILNKIIPGKSTDLLIDLPPIRLPMITNVLHKTYIKSKMFVLEAGPLFVIGAILITILQYTGALEWIANAFAPITVGWLKLPKEVSQTFIMGIIRRDFGAAGLSALAKQGLLNPLQIVISLITITLFVPCIAAIMVIFKERSLQESLLIWIGSFIISFFTGGIVAHLLS